MPSTGLHGTGSQSGVLIRSEPRYGLESAAAHGLVNNRAEGNAPLTVKGLVEISRG